MMPTTSPPSPAILSVKAEKRTARELNSTLERPTDLAASSPNFLIPAAFLPKVTLTALRDSPRAEASLTVDLTKFEIPAAAKTPAIGARADLREPMKAVPARFPAPAKGVVVAGFSISLLAVSEKPLAAGAPAFLTPEAICAPAAAPTAGIWELTARLTSVWKPAKDGRTVT